MDFYDQIIENPLFFRWIYYPSPEINAYWEHYLKNHPEQAKEIKTLKYQFEKNFSYKEEKLSEPEKKALANRIISQLEIVDEKKKKWLNYRNAFGYAAIGFLFAMITGGLFYWYSIQNGSQQYVENDLFIESAEQPVLIINEEEKIQLDEGKSFIRYSPKGQITVQQDSSYQTKYVTANTELNKLLIPYGSRSEIILSDGSHVFLNAGSKLVYPSRFEKDKREVYLTGEAYFEVKENKLKPFVLKTDDVTIEVLGTSFNVSAYPEDNISQTVLAEGSIKIKYSIGGLFKKERKMRPGELASYNKEYRKTQISKVAVEDYTLWTEGLLSFSDTELNRITKKLERYYNIKIHFEDPLDGMIQITGKLDISQKKEKVFEYLTNLTALKFIQTNDNKYEIKQ